MPMNPRLLRPRRRGGFDPRTIAGLEAWWDAADSANVTLDSGRVATWKDKSGKGRDASNLTSGTTQPSYEAAVQNGLSAVRFATASSQFLATSSAADWKFFHDGTLVTVFACGAFTSAATGSNTILTTLTAAATGTGTTLGVGTGGRVNVAVRVLDSSSAISVNTATGLFTNGQDILLEFVLRPANSTAANRVAVGFNAQSSNLTNSFNATPSSNDPTNPLQIGRFAGGTGAVTCDMYELAMYSRELSESERLAVRQYLYAKWGITGT